MDLLLRGHPTNCFFCEHFRISAASAWVFQSSNGSVTIIFPLDLDTFGTLSRLSKCDRASTDELAQQRLALKPTAGHVKAPIWRKGIFSIL